MPGLHFIWWPFQSLKPMTWSWHNQCGESVNMTFQYGSYDAVQLDPPIVKCITKDHIQVGVDVTITYKVTDMQAAAYTTHDPLNLLYQTLMQAVRNCVAQMLASELNGRDASLAQQIHDYVNTNYGEKRGLKCDSVTVQNVELDETILKANQAIHARKAHQEMTLGQKQAEHELAMQALRTREEQQARLHQLELDKARHEQALLTMAEQETVKRRQLTGITAEHVMALQMAKAQANIFEGAQKVVYAPLDYFKALSFIRTTE